MIERPLKKLIADLRERALISEGDGFGTHGFSTYALLHEAATRLEELAAEVAAREVTR